MDLNTKRLEHEEQMKEIAKTYKRKRLIARIICAIYLAITLPILYFVFVPSGQTPWFIFANVFNIPLPILILIQVNGKYKKIQVSLENQLREKAPMGRLRF